MSAMPHEADYIARTIETVRNHKDADNCWPQWANIFADQIEAQAAALAVVERERDTLRAAVVQVRDNAKAWHGNEGIGTGHYRALDVIGRWCDEALAAVSPEGEA